MKPRLSVLLFVAGLLVLGILAIACGDDDDGDESDEDAIRNVFQEHVAATNDRDFDRLAETYTATFDEREDFQFLMDNPDFRVENVEILSVMVAGDEARVMFTHGASNQRTDTMVLKREDGRWLVDNILG